MKTRILTLIALSALLAATDAAAKGGTTPVAGPNPLPSAPPSPDVVIRESFGFGPNFVRPLGGKGLLAPTFGGLGDFWAEYPGSSATWAAAEQGWQFAGCSIDPFELPSPVQTFGACTVSPWADRIVRFPDALVPFRGLAGTYEVSADVYPPPLAGAYAAIGLTSSGAVTGNFQASGQAWLLVRQGALLDGVEGEWELRTGGAAGTILAAGTVTLQPWNPVALRVDPVAHAVTVTVNGVAYGPFAAPEVAPRCAGFEGQGVLDDFVVRSVL
jgi:hypothetical protein